MTATFQSPPPPPPTAPHPLDIQNHLASITTHTRAAAPRDDDHGSNDWNCNSSNRKTHQHEEDSESSYHDHCYADMETPLVAHGSRKNWSRNSCARHQKQQKQLHTLYSSIILDDGDGDGDDDDSCNRSGDSNKNRSLSNDTDINDDDRSVSTTASIASSFRDSLMLPFVDDQGSLENVASGLAALALTGAVIGLVMPKNPNLQQHGLRGYPYYPFCSSVIGYTYTLLWSSCFYPQVLLNWRRQSTHGLSNDFAVLNFMGWTFYAIYLSSMYFSREIQQQYHARFGNHGSSTVQSNDVLFSVHAAALSFIYLVQIFYYRRHNNDSSTKNKTTIKPLLALKSQTWVLVLGMALPTAVVPLLIRAHILNSNCWLSYFYCLSFFKICCTLTKYSKQVVLNYQRKSTQGWNIWYTVLECAGGSLSMLQIVLDSWAMNNMTGITGNLAKFALGFATLFFDAIFFTQHYILYPQHHPDPEPRASIVIPPSDRFEIPNEVMSSSNDASSIVTCDYDDDGDSITGAEV